MRKKTYSILVTMFLAFMLIGCAPDVNEKTDPTLPPLVEEEEEDLSHLIDEVGLYIDQNNVALYIRVYQKLPANYHLKEMFEKHVSSYWTAENLMCVGGDRFYNREGLLPEKEKRIYFEADINYRGSTSRGSERIVFSNDGLIFYTGDHYDSFIEYDRELLTWKLG